MTTIRSMHSLALAAALAAAASFGPTDARAQSELTIWTMGGDQAGWVKWLETGAQRYEAANPGSKVKISWYDKSALLVALNTSLRAGQGPDILYTEPDMLQFPDNGWVLPLENRVDWSNIHPWAKGASTRAGHAWQVPFTAYTNEVYYNRALLKELGVTLPPNGQVTQAQFTELVKKARAAGMEPIALGVADRPFPGAYLSFEPLLRKLGKDDYQKLLDGKLSYSDPRVLQVLNWLRGLVDDGALPKTFSTMSLTDSYAFFFNRRAVMFPQGTWYSQRAFNSPEKGGQPAGFDVGVMNFPAMDDGACNNCKTLAVSGAYSVNAASKQPDAAVKFINVLATPELGALWLTQTNSQTTVKLAAPPAGGDKAAYFADLAAVNKDADYFIGIPLNFLQGQCREAFVQVINVGLPAGLVTVQDAVKRMDAACYKG